MPSTAKKMRRTVDADPTGQRGMNLLILLVSLLFMLLLVPLVEGSAFASTLFHVGITAVLVSAAFAQYRRHRLLVIGLGVAMIMGPVSWLTMFVDHPWLFAAICIAESTFFASMAVMTLGAVLQKHLATLNSIVGAICAYLLIGLSWAIVYLAIDTLDESAFTADLPPEASLGEVPAFSRLVYFSFVTMSTLGYGDITPQSGIAQTLAWMQSVTGQFYLAVIVAWLISEIPRRERDR